MAAAAAINETDVTLSYLSFSYWLLQSFTYRLRGKTNLCVEAILTISEKQESLHYYSLLSLVLTLVLAHHWV